MRGHTSNISRSRYDAWDRAGRPPFPIIRVFLAHLFLRTRPPTQLFGFPVFLRPPISRKTPVPDVWLASLSFQGNYLGFMLFSCLQPLFHFFPFCVSLSLLRSRCLVSSRDALPLPSTNGESALRDDTKQRLRRILRNP